jgi:ferredoxin
VSTPPTPLPAATYEHDRVAPITQWDERDMLFARHDLFRRFGEGSHQFAEYYAAHPERLAYDSRVARMATVTPPGDSAMADTQFMSIRQISADASVDGAPSGERIDLTPQAAVGKVKAMARLLGADVAGAGPLSQEWVYSHAARSFGDSPGYLPWGAPINLTHHINAVAMGFAMDRSLIAGAPGLPTMVATGQGYARGAWASVQLALYIRRLGYSARAHHLYNYQVLCVPVAVDCGLGELSRAGYLLNKQYGLGMRLAIVTTDLPLQHDRPADIGAQSFCTTCKICAEECPCRAIPMADQIVSNGIRKWKLDEEKCYLYWQAKGTDCGVCMAACPWTRRRSVFHRLMAEAATRKGPHQGVMTRAHKLVYGKHRPAPLPPYLRWPD